MALLACPAGLEPTTPSLEGWCSILVELRALHRTWCACHGDTSMSGRGGEIRTPDILLPKQARYQAALHPEGQVFYPLVPGNINATDFGRKQPGRTLARCPYFWYQDAFVFVL